MDEYKHLYYDRLGQTGAEETENIGEFGDISDREELETSAFFYEFNLALNKEQM